MHEPTILVVAATRREMAEARGWRTLQCGVGPIEAAAAVAAAPSCTCLKKEYTPDNLVVFSDVCTKEVASAPIGNTQATLPIPQQAPVQQ